jgi:predicted nucleic acid-binding protein
MCGPRRQAFTYFTCDTELVRASEIGEAWKLSFWDGMILAAAEQDGARELLSEDLKHGQDIAGMRVVNPFL